MKARHLLIGGGMIVASVGAALATMPVTANAASPSDTSCYTCSPPPPPTTDPNQLPFTPSGGTTPTSSSTNANANVTQQQSSITSLPFTGADVEEIAVVGGGALVVGAVLTRRRRRPRS